MILADWEIAYLVKKFPQFISPFVSEKTGTPSYGLTSYGYDIRLSSEDFRVYHGSHESIIDPLQFDREVLVTNGKLNYRDNLSYYTLGGNSYGLGVSYERIKMPDNCLGLVVGKSTYARCGLIVNCTPLEPGWEGHITLEFSNSSPSPIRLYADLGIAQIIFLSSVSGCLSPYGARKYQNQGHEVILP